MSEPEVGDPSVVMKVIKQRFARHLHRARKLTSSAQTALWESAPEPVWQKRFYDFNVWSEGKRIEKLRYMHRNPVKRGLVASPELWKWSSFRAYALGEASESQRVGNAEDEDSTAGSLETKTRRCRRHRCPLLEKREKWGTPFS